MGREQPKLQGKTESNKPFNKILFGMDLHACPGQNMVLMMIGQNVNQHMFNKCRLYHDNIGMIKTDIMLI